MAGKTCYAHDPANNLWCKDKDCKYLYHLDTRNASFAQLLKDIRGVTRTKRPRSADPSGQEKPKDKGGKGTSSAPQEDGSTPASSRAAKRAKRKNKA